MEGYIKKVLENLKLKRRVFYSEADLQFEFAWELHKILPEAEIRLERPVTINNEVYYIDIWVLTSVYYHITAIMISYRIAALP